MRSKAGFLESKLLYGLRLRAKDVTTLSIRLANFTFFESTLFHKVLTDFPLCDQLQKLIRGQCQHPEHQVRHDLARSPHADLPPPELILQAAIHAFNERAFSIAVRFRPTQLAGNSRCDLAL